MPHCLPVHPSLSGSQAPTPPILTASQPCYLAAPLEAIGEKGQRVAPSPPQKKHNKENSKFHFPTFCGGCRQELRTSHRNYLWGGGRTPLPPKKKHWTSHLLLLVSSGGKGMGGRGIEWIFPHAFRCIQEAQHGAREAPWDAHTGSSNLPLFHPGTLRWDLAEAKASPPCLIISIKAFPFPKARTRNAAGNHLWDCNSGFLQPEQNHQLLAGFWLSLLDSVLSSRNLDGCKGAGGGG